MSERRHRTTLGQDYPAMPGCPIDQAPPGKLRPPAEPASQWRKRKLEDTARPAFGADMVDEDQFAPSLQHADEIIERSFGIRYCGDDILRHHGIERTVLERQVLGVHHREQFDIGKA